MIKAVIFDLAGTLNKTEKLKAHAYAQTAMTLCPYEINEDDVYHIRPMPSLLAALEPAIKG